MSRPASPLLLRVSLGLLGLLLLPVVLVAGALGLHWLGELPEARALNAELARAQRVVAADTTVVRADPARARAFTCCGDSGLSARVTLGSDDDVAVVATRLAADLRAAGWTVQQDGLADSAPVVDHGTYAVFSAYRSPTDDAVQVSVYQVQDAGTSVELQVR